ncbi:MAG TPA: gamma-glutamyl-gamma-aminobutyrate hydrolase family protein [Nitrospiria bacterium]|nr:gamma-glutamyl-gamma-aminobutyrate hydrolase family protein [Nitrospiria bacterium]
MKPIIGITSDFQSGKKGEATYFLRARYVRAIRDMGGIPFILPITEDPAFQAELLDRLDGVLITGSGPDLDPRLYGEKKRAKFKIMSPERARFEIALARRAIREDRPVLGICGGLQLLNVALGGSLIQDIATQIEGALSHQQETEATRPWHRVKISPGTKLYQILGRKAIRVNSSHHQAPQRVAKGLIINAVASDGIIEGLEDPESRFVLGVQWHPEFLYRKDEASRRLFRSFLNEATRS